MKGGIIEAPQPSEAAPYGWDVWTHTEVVPKPSPLQIHWTIGPVRPKAADWVAPEPTHPSYVPEHESEITLQLTADQEVVLTISGQDKYGNPVNVSGDTVWASSDESIISVAYSADGTKALATAVGPAGTASVTVTNDVNLDGTGDYMGSLAIDVVAGEMAEIQIQEGTPQAKGTEPHPEQQGATLGKGGRR